jgi:hypothetical protein
VRPVPSKKLWAYIARLEKAIKETMESSPEIAALVEKIQAEGVEVSLNCIALFSDPHGRTFTSPAGKIVKGQKRRAGPRKKASPGRPKKEGAARPVPKLELSDKDREFLRSIGIRFD